MTLNQCASPGGALRPFLSFTPLAVIPELLNTTQYQPEPSLLIHAALAHSRRLACLPMSTQPKPHAVRRLLSRVAGGGLPRIDGHLLLA